MLWPFPHVILDSSHPPPRISYVDSLETRLEKMEGMLSRVCPHHHRPSASHGCRSSCIRTATSRKKWSSKDGPVIFNPKLLRISRLPRWSPVLPRTPLLCMHPSAYPVHLEATAMTPLPKATRTCVQIMSFYPASERFASHPAPQGTLADPAA